MRARLPQTRHFLYERKVFLRIYQLGLVAVVVGIFYSRAVLSIGQLIIAGNFLLEGRLKEKFTFFFRQPLAVLLVSLYTLHLVGVVYSTDMGYALKDLRVKLPILLFPIVFSTRRLLDERAFRHLIYLFITMLISSTMCSMINYWLNEIPADMRYMSLFISHIRFSLLACLAIVFSTYYALKSTGTTRVLLLTGSVWVVFFLLFTQAVTGIVILMLLLPLFWYKLRSRLSGSQAFSAVSVLMWMAFALIVGLFAWIAGDYYSGTQSKKIADLQFTENGCRYVHGHADVHHRMRENGYFVFQNICHSEIQAAWNERSTHRLLSSDPRMHLKEHVLIRFLTSKGLPKNRASVMALSDEEIVAVEKGTTNVDHMGKPGIYIRLHQIFWEIDNYLDQGNFNGHSLAMRLEFWKTGWHVIRKYPLVGVGTGDIEKAFQEQYNEDDSVLRKEWRFRSHNQWITMAATFGIPGLILFLMVIFGPVFARHSNFLYLAFAFVLICSMVTEDTLDTQIGVTFYAFFNSLLLFQWPMSARE